MARRRTFDPTKHKRNKFGRLVSAKASLASKRNSENTGFQNWRKALSHAAKELKVKVTPMNIQRGTPLYNRARQLFDKMNR